MTECKICFTEFEPIDNQSICFDCQREIMESLGIKLKVKSLEVINKKDIALANFVYLVSQLGGLTDYLEHAVENHTHGTKMVNTVNIE